uniref:Uncharacterized protein n=1 Tax=Tanacetum cinerariifolium TaxID=118510 RepID=A0A699GGY2_TANCI|nr:hypothetical protein [Tanacetum cinerariifolium]
MRFDQRHQVRRQHDQQLHRQRAGEVVVFRLRSVHVRRHAAEEATADIEHERGRPVHVARLDQAPAATVHIEALVAGTGLAAHGQHGAVGRDERRARALGRAVRHHATDRLGHHCRHFRRQHLLVGGGLGFGDRRVVRRVLGKMQRRDALAGLAHAAVDDDAHQLGQRGRTVGRCAQRGGIRRHQRIERIAHLLPLLVQFHEAFHFQQAGDAAVLGVLAVGLEQPLVDFLALFLAGGIHLRERGAGVGMQVRHHPQLERVDAGQVAAVGQRPLVDGVLVVQLGHALVRHLVLRRQVGAQEGGKLRLRGFRIHGAMDDGQAHRRAAQVGQHDVVELADLLALVLGVEAAQELAPFLVGKARQVGGAARIVGVRQQRCGRARRLEHVELGDVAHQAHEHQVGRVAQRFGHGQDLAVVFLGEVAEVMEAAAGEEALARVARILALHGRMQHGRERPRVRVLRQSLEVIDRPQRQLVLRIDVHLGQPGGIEAGELLVQLVHDVEVAHQRAQLGRGTQVQLGAFVDVERLVEVIGLQAQQVVLRALFQQGKAVDHVGGIAIAQHALAGQARFLGALGIAQVAQHLGHRRLGLRVKRAGHVQVEAVQVVHAVIAQQVGQVVANRVRRLARDKRHRRRRLQAVALGRVQLLLERHVAHGGRDHAVLGQDAQVAVGQLVEVFGAVAQVVAGAALRDHQAQRFLVHERRVGVRIFQVARQDAVERVETASVPHPHAVTDAIDFAIAGLGRQRHRVQVFDHDAAARAGGVGTILVRAQAGRDHLLQLVRHRARAAFGRVAVFFDLRGQRAAAGRAVAGAQRAHAFFQHGLGQPVPFHGRVALGVGIVEQFAVFDVQQRADQRHRRLLELVVDALRVRGGVQLRGAAVVDGQPGAGLLVVRGEHAVIGQLHHLARHARLRADLVLALAQLADIVGQVGVAEPLVVRAVVRVADRVARPRQHLVGHLAGQVGKHARLQRRRAAFLYPEVHGKRRAHQHHQDQRIACALALFGRLVGPWRGRLIWRRRRIGRVQWGLREVRFGIFNRHGRNNSKMTLAPCSQGCAQFARCTHQGPAKTGTASHAGKFHLEAGQFVAQLLERLQRLLRFAFDAQLDMAARGGVAHARQAEHFDARIARFQRHHQRRQCRLGRLVYEHRLLQVRGAVEQVGVTVVEHPFDHGPGHDREARHEIMLVQREAGNVVVRVRDQRGAVGKLRHFQAVQVFRRVQVGRLARLFAHLHDALLDVAPAFLVQHQRQAQRIGRGLARVVVGRGADAAAAEHDVVGGKRALQRGRDARRIVAQHLGPVQLQAARGQDVHDFREVLVDAPAGQDFVADDDQSDGHGAGQRLQAVIGEPQAGEDKHQHVQPDRRRRQEREEYHRHHAAEPDRTGQGAGRAGQHADHQQAPAVLRQDGAPFLGAGVIGQHVVHHHAAREPAPQHGLHQHGQRRERVQRQRQQPQADEHGHAADGRGHAAPHRTALPLFQLRVVAQAHVAADHRHRHHADEDQRGHDHQRQQQQHGDQRHHDGRQRAQAERAQPAAAGGKQVVLDEQRVHAVDQRKARPQARNTLLIGTSKKPSRAAAVLVEKRSCAGAQRASQTDNATRSRFFELPSSDYILSCVFDQALQRQPVLRPETTAVFAARHDGAVGRRFRQLVADAGGDEFRREVGGPEKDIPHRQQHGKIAAAQRAGASRLVADADRVVHAVVARRHQQPLAQPAEMDAHVGMLQALQDARDRHQDHVLRRFHADAQRDHAHVDVAQEVVQQVIAVVAPQVHVLLAVVQAVQRPPPVEMVRGAVVPVIEEIEHHEIHVEGAQRTDGRDQRFQVKRLEALKAQQAGQAVEQRVEREEDQYREQADAVQHGSVRARRSRATRCLRTPLPRTRPSPAGTPAAGSPSRTTSPARCRASLKIIASSLLEMRGIVRVRAQRGKAEAFLLQAADQRFQVGGRPCILARPDAHVGQEDIAIPQVAQGLAQQYRIRVSRAGELVAGKAQRRPAHVRITARLGGSHRARRRAAGRRAPDRVEVGAGQLHEAAVDALDLFTILVGREAADFSGRRAKAGLDAELAVLFAGQHVVVERVRADGMALGHARLPVGRPRRIERVIAAHGFLVGEKKRGLDVVAFQGLGNELGLRLAAGVERQWQLEGAVRTAAGRQRDDVSSTLRRVHEEHAVRRAADRDQLGHLAGFQVDHRHFFNPAQRHPHGLAVVGDFHAVRAAGHIDLADVFQRLLVDDVNRVRHPVRDIVDHFHVIAAHDADQQVLVVRRHGNPGRQLAHRHGPFDSARGQVDGADLVAALLGDEHDRAGRVERHVAGQLGQRDALGQGQISAVVAVQVHAVQAQRVRHEPFLVGRKADLVRVEDVLDGALDLARLGIEENQFVAHRAGHDQRLVVGRGHQVVRLLADREGGQAFERGLVQQLHGSIPRVEHNHDAGLGALDQRERANTGQYDTAETAEHEEIACKSKDFILRANTAVPSGEVHIYSQERAAALHVQDAAATIDVLCLTNRRKSYVHHYHRLRPAIHRTDRGRRRRSQSWSKRHRALHGLAAQRRRHQGRQVRFEQRPQ